MTTHLTTPGDDMATIYAHQAPADAVAYQYADSTSDARWIYDDVEAHTLIVAGATVRMVRVDRRTIPWKIRGDLWSGQKVWEITRGVDGLPPTLEEINEALDFVDACHRAAVV